MRKETRSLAKILFSCIREVRPRLGILLTNRQSGRKSGQPDGDPYRPSPRRPFLFKPRVHRHPGVRSYIPVASGGTAGAEVARTRLDDDEKEDEERREGERLSAPPSALLKESVCLSISATQLSASR